MSKIGEIKDEGKCLLYDPYNGQFFYMTMDEAQNHVNRNPEIYTGQFVSNIVTLENNDMQPCVTMQIKENYELPAFLYTKTVIPDPFEPDYFDSKKIIFSGNCTIVIWKDGTKTIARCNKWDDFSPEAGVAICFMKHVLGEAEAKKILRNANNIFESEVEG